MLTIAAFQGFGIGVALGSAIWAGGVAATKHRRVALWALIGLLCGLIGVGIALIVKPLPAKRTTRAPARFSRTHAPSVAT